MLTAPLKLEAADKINGWMTIGELSFLAERALRAKTILEIGSFEGRSTRAMADNGPDATIVCVDPWNYHIGAGIKSSMETYSFFYANLSRYIKSGKVIPVKKRFEDFKTEMEFDFIFIDGDHRTPSVTHDIEKALTLLAPNGIIAGHDYGREWPEVKPVVDNFFPQCKSSGDDLVDTKVLIALTMQEVMRKTHALAYFFAIERKPEHNCQITTVHGQSPAEARNQIFQLALTEKCSHILLCDDDMAFPADIISRLIAHDKDVVTGLYLKRDFPHIPCLFDDVAGDEGHCKFMLLTGEENYKPELVRVTNMGFGAVLIKTSIFEKLSEYAPTWVTLGEIQKDGWCDDVAFFNKCRKAGIELYCDMSLHVGHMTTVTIFPKYVNGKWFTEYQSPTGGCLIPQHEVVLAEPT